VEGACRYLPDFLCCGVESRVGQQDGDVPLGDLNFKAMWRVRADIYLIFCVVELNRA
jgi:hypothetical protein